MSAIINWLETVFGDLPLPLLEVWGRFAYIIGFVLAICAFGGFTFRPGGRWGLGREYQAWDARAVLSIPVTFVLIIGTGYIGSFIVLVPGAQTFESLKDLMVFLCILLFGYPALIAVPFAYGISDLIEGVPPGFLFDWLPGYFINPACFWIAYQLFGKNPDFRRVRVWALYLLFVLAFMGMEPLLWGYICAGKFTSVISYGNITPALFFTTAITWLMAPFAMLGALPLARKFRMFWAEIPGHVKERRLARKEWVWEAGAGAAQLDIVSPSQGWPIRMVLLTPFIALVLLMVGATAYVTLRSAADDAHKLAIRLHEEISDNINLQLDEYLAEQPNADNTVISGGINTLLKALPIAKHGVALVVNRAGNIIASSAKADDPIAAKAITRLREISVNSTELKKGIQFRFDYVTEKPLSREIWLAHAIAYEDRAGGHADWMVVTLMPESFYLAGVQAGNSRSAMVFAVALLLSLTVAALLAAMVTNRLRRISLATQTLAAGNLDQRAPGSRMEELNTLARSFNDMAERLKKSFNHLNDEIKLRQQTEESLRMMQFSVDHAGDSMFWVNRSGNILYVNDAACAGRGYTREEMLRMKIFELNPDFSPNILEQTFKDLQQHGTLTFESHHRTKDGAVFPVEVTANYVSLGGQEFSFSTVRDITERKRAETHIQHLNRVYAVLSDINQTIVHEKNPQTILTEACRIAVEKGKFRMAWIGLMEASTCRLKLTAHAGATPDTLNIVQTMLNAGPAEASCAFTAQAIQTGQHGICNDIEHDPQAAHWRALALERQYHSMTSLPLKWGNQVIGTFNLYASEPDFFDEEEIRLLDELAQDISFALEVSEHETERQRAEKELRWRTAFFEAQVDSTIDGILVVDEQGRRILQNQRFLELFKVPDALARIDNDTELVQHAIKQIKDPHQFSERVAHLYAHPDETGRDEIELKDGRIFDRYSAPVRDKAGKYYGRIWTFRDITGQRKLEEQLRQSQKMEAVGQLASGVAHDFNNILAIIQIESELMQLEGNLSAAQAEHAIEIGASAQRAAALTRQLLLFSRKEKMQPRELDLDKSINGMTKMLQRALGETVQLQFKFSMQPLFIRADPGLMDQVLMNLAVNARDAMPKGGNLIIETSVVELDELSSAALPQSRPGTFVCLSVSDTGTGIPPEILPKIFDPFFTTKEVGKGTGLGLATVFGIVQQHQGWITVSSEVGSGTTFRIYLPRMAGVADGHETRTLQKSVAGGHETILLVEDELALRASIRTTLARLGYRVLEAETGAEALKIWNHHQTEIALLLTDLVMPGGMTGKELAERLLQTGPKLKVIYISGYSPDATDRNFALEEGTNFLTKPFAADKLAQTIRNRLDKSP